MGATRAVPGVGAVARTGGRHLAARGRDGLLIVGVEVVVGADVAGLLGPLALVLVRLDHRRLDHLAAGRVDRVGDVRVQLGPAVGVAHRPVLVELVAATVAEPRPQVVLAAALAAPVGQLPARHGHERPLGALDDLQVAHDEGVVERDRAERQEPLVVLLAQLDANFRDLHRWTP